MKNVFITIVDYNGKENTIECLESLNLVKKDGICLHVVVVNTAENVSYKLNKIYNNFTTTVLNPGKNAGFAGGQNRAIRYALENGSDYILILNNDTIADKNLINELMHVLDTNKSVGIVSPKIYFAKGYEFHKNKYKKEDLGKVLWYAGAIMDWQNIVGSHRGVDEVDRGQFNTNEKTDFASGCAMLVKKEVFEKVGLFDEKYFLYYEDADLSIRAKKANFDIFYAAAAILWHKNAGSAGGSGSKLQDYYIGRNRLLFGMKYASLRSKLAILKESFYLLFKGRMWQKKGIQDFYAQRFEKGSYG